MFMFNGQIYLLDWGVLAPTRPSERARVSWNIAGILERHASILNAILVLMYILTYIARNEHALTHY